jgi:hypothetical protein
MKKKWSVSVSKGCFRIFGLTLANEEKSLQWLADKHCKILRWLFIPTGAILSQKNDKSDKKVKIMSASTFPTSV